MTATATGAAVQLARYRISAGERVVLGQRILGVVRVTDRPADRHGRSYLVERELTSYAELRALAADYVEQAAVWDAVPVIPVLAGDPRSPPTRKRSSAFGDLLGRRPVAALSCEAGDGAVDDDLPPLVALLAGSGGRHVHDSHARGRPRRAMVIGQPQTSEIRMSSSPSTTEAKIPAQRAVADHLRLLTANELDQWVALFATDCILNFPFAPEGMPSRVEGHEALLNHMRSFPDTFDVRFADLRFHDTVDPQLAVAEFRLTGTAVPTGKPYEQTCVSIVHTDADGLITRYEDYWNPLVAIEALSGDETSSQDTGVAESFGN